MKSSTIRTMVIGVTTLLVLVMGFQLYWLDKTYKLEENEFNNKVSSALRSMMETMRYLRHDTVPFAGGISQPLPNYFMVQTKYETDTDMLSFQLKKVIEEFYIFTSYKFGVYNANLDSMIHVHYMSYNHQHTEHKTKPLPVLKRPYNYIAVYFPDRTSYIIREMSFWVFSTLLLLLVITGFGISLFKLFKQRQLSEIQKEFVNNMTHEFRTPVSTIRISTEVLKNNPAIQADKRLSQYAGIIEKEVDHLESQVDRVLQVAKMENHSVHLQKEAVNVHEIIREGIINFDDKIKQKQGQFILSLEATRPVIRVDRLHFINIIFNLIDNAIKYVAQPEIKLTTIDYKDGIAIKVSDNGPGIPKKYQKFLFSKFFRVPTGNIHEVKGFGLGLNYVKTYTKAHNGHVKVESKPQKGCTFTLYFPESIPE